MKAERTAYALVLAAAFATPFSLPAGRGFLALSLILLAVHLAGTRRAPPAGRTSLLGLAFILCAVVVTVLGVNPELGVPKLRKLLWFLALPVCAALVNTPDRLSRFLASFAAGTGVLALYMCVRNPIRAWHTLQAGTAPDFTAALVLNGSMTNGQRLLLGIVATLGFILLSGGRGKQGWLWWGLLALECAAMIINFKRGSWIAATLVAALFLAVKVSRRYVLVVVLVVLASLAVPSVRSRLGGLEQEVRAGRGGRLTMWTEIAPELIRRYPWGVGYRSLTNEMMREIAPEVEPERDHLHSNPLQVLVATGWLGFALYLAWMLSALGDGVAFVRNTRGGPATEQMGAMVLFFMLFGLLLNGLVEYNLGDSELVLPYAFVMGCAAAGRKRSAAG